MHHPPRTPANYWIRSGFLTLLERGTGLVFALGTVMLLSRGTTKPDFAAWGLFLLITYTLEMGRNGLIQNGLVRFLALHQTDAQAYKAILTGAFYLNIGFSLLSNLILWAATDWLANTYQTPALAEILPIYFVTNVVMIFSSQFNFVQQANFEFRGIFWSTFLQRGFLFVWVVYCRLFDHTMILWQLACAMLVGSCLGALASWRYARPFWPASFWSGLFQSAHRNLGGQWALKLASYGRYVLGTNLSAMFYKNIDKLTLGHLLGPAAFAIYDIAGRVTQLVEAPSFSIAAIVFPQSAQRLETQGPEGIRTLYERSVGAILAIILPFLLFVLLFAEFAVRILAGPHYAESANILRLTAFFGLFMPFAVQFGTILDSTGKPKTNFRYTLLTALLNLGLNALFIRKFGLIGAALATLTGYSISFVLMQRLLRQHFDIRWWRAFVYVPQVYRRLGRMAANFRF